MVLQNTDFFVKSRYPVKPFGTMLRRGSLNDDFANVMFGTLSSLYASLVFLKKAYEYTELLVGYYNEDKRIS